MGIPIPAVSTDMSRQTIQTEITETENSGSIRDDCDFEIVGRISFQDLVDVAFVFQTDVQTLRIDINV